VKEKEIAAIKVAPKDDEGGKGNKSRNKSEGKTLERKKPAEAKEEPAAEAKQPPKPKAPESAPAPAKNKGKAPVNAFDLLAGDDDSDEEQM
jgi:hypothetical protein